MDPCGLILNKDDDDDEMIKQASSKHQATMKQTKSTGQWVMHVYFQYIRLMFDSSCKHPIKQAIVTEWGKLTVAPFGWSRHWSVVSPASVRRPAARRTHWTFYVKTATFDSYCGQ